jgi:hypothetical protein
MMLRDGITPAPGRPAASPSDAKTKKYLYRKIDLRLMPLLLLTDFFNTLVRMNLPNAIVAGMDKDLKLDDSHISTATAIFFVPYVIFGTLRRQPGDDFN